MKKINIIFGLLLLLLLNNKIFSQPYTVFFQGGEGTANDNWNFTPPTNMGGPASLQPGAVATFPRTGSFAIRAGGGNPAGCTGGSNCVGGGNGSTCSQQHGNTILFATVCTSVMAGVQLSVYHRCHVDCGGPGFDTNEKLEFEVSLNGGAFTLQGTVQGFNDYDWLYTTNPAGTGPTVPNPFVYNVPAGTNTFAFRVRATINRSDELFYLDDVRLTTTTAGFPYPVANACFAVLPITLTDFYAKPNESSVTLNWRIETEINVDHYIIERSTDGLNFTPISTVKSIAETDGYYNLNYSTVDYAPKNGINYYRLVNVDKDGSTQYNKTIMVNFNQTYSSNVWVNQTERDIIVSFEPSFSNKTFYLMDMNGKKVGEYKNLNTELNYFTIDKLNLPKGLYVIGCIDAIMPPQKLIIN